MIAEPVTTPENGVPGAAARYDQPPMSVPAPHTRDLWVHRSGRLDCRIGHLVGIVNATPDSFTDQGRHFGTGASVARGEAVAAAGASVVEVGGESLRFSPRTDAREEAERVVPVIERLVRLVDVPVAIDTFKPLVAEAALAAGASIVNDPSGLRDPAMTRAVADHEAGLVLTHFFGIPKIRPRAFPDVDLPTAIVEWALPALDTARDAGIPSERIVIDPGVGLGKSPEQDLQLLHRLAELDVLDRPVFVPISHKKVLGAVTGRDASARQAATAAALAWCRTQGARIFRVHDVEVMRDVLVATEALMDGTPRRWHDVVM